MMKAKTLMLAALAACTPEIDAYQPLELEPARQIDVLFVVDDSADRTTYDRIAAELDTLTGKLAEIDGQVPSVHVAVVSSDLGVSGTDDIVPRSSIGSCVGFGQAGVFTTAIDDLRGDGLARLRDALAATPSGGCQVQQPLEAMRRGLDEAVNPGFWRTDAMLSIVFLTSDDDCSMRTGALLDGSFTAFRCTEEGVVCDPDDPGREGAHRNCRPRDGGLLNDVADYAAFLRTIKPDPNDLVVSAVAGPRTSFYVRNLGSPVLQPSCTGDAGSARPAVRLGALVDTFGGSFVDACTQDKAPERIAQPIVDRQRSCFPALAMTERDACTVRETANGVTAELPACGDGVTQSCWYAYADANACPMGDHVGIAVRRSTPTATAGARLEARCFEP
jgi:hypothetical protein